MHEETIAAFLTDKIDVEVLNSEALSSVRRYDAVRSAIEITDLDRSFSLSRDHIIKLCDAAIEGRLSEASLNAIAFALIATDHFEWDDDIIAEVLNDWSAPEVNYPLTHSNLSMHRDWLRGVSTPPERPWVPTGIAKSKPISQRLKVKELRPD